MVEVAEVDVEAIDMHRQIVCLTFLVVCRLSIDNPLIARLGDIHGTGRRYEVCRECHRLEALGVVLVVDGDAQVLVVVTCSSKHLYLFLHDGAWFQIQVGARPRQGSAIDENLGSVGVHRVLQEVFQRLGGTCGHFTLVSHINGEACRITIGHIGH